MENEPTRAGSTRRRMDARPSLKDRATMLGEVRGRDGARLLIDADPRDIAHLREDCPQDEVLEIACPGSTRPWVRALSEAGFSISQELALADGTGWIRAKASSWRIVPARPRDRAGIEDLFHESFPHARRPPAHWRWKYDENPWGVAPASLALDVRQPDGSIGAFYTGYPVPFVTPNPDRALIALQMGDTMTAPAARAVGRGTSTLLARCVRHFFAGERGRWSFYFGFNTGPIQRFCRWFIGGHQVASVGWWSRPASHPGSPSSRYRIERLAQAGPELDRLFAQTRKDYGFQIRRDARWVGWRYLDCPDTEYVVLTARRWGRLRGWAVFRRDGDRLLWGDALVDQRRRGVIADLLEAALLRPELSGVSKIETWAGGEPAWWPETLSSMGFVRADHPQGLGMMLLPDSSAPALEFEKLHYTMGDGDLF